MDSAMVCTTSTDAKADLARAHGCHYVIKYDASMKFAGDVKQLTNGRGVRVVYDGVGKDTFVESLECLQPFGLMASFGNASGPVPPVNIMLLAQKGSLFLTRPTLFTYVQKREDLAATAEDLFNVVLAGGVRIEVNQRYPLKDTADAHRDLESRKTTGSTVLLP